jgi:integrase
LAIAHTLNGKSPTGKCGKFHVFRNLFWRYGKHHDLAGDEPSFVIHTPKAETSPRGVDLLPELKKELLSFKLQTESKDRKGLIFRSREGTPLDPNNTFTRWFKPAARRAVKKAEEEKDEAAAKALVGLHLHDLRHTFDSWQVALC